MKGVVLITADSLRGDHFPSPPRRRAKFLEKLSKRSWVLERAYASSSYTAYSFPSIFTGTFPLFKGSPRIGPRITIPEFLKSVGFICGGFISSNIYAEVFSGAGRTKSGFHVFRSYGPRWYAENLMKRILSDLRRLWREEKSREEFLEGLATVMYDHLTLGRDLGRRYFVTALVKLFLRDPRAFGVFQVFTDYRATKAAEKFIEACVDLRKPFFVWIHYMSTHLPYGIWRQDWYEALLEYFRRKAMIGKILSKQRAKKGEIVELKEAYSDGVMCLDHLLEDFFSFLDEKELEEVLVIFTSDHGEEIFEHGNYGHLPKLFDVNLRIPFLIYLDGSHRRIDAMASHYDIFPAILSFLGEFRLKRKLMSLMDGSPLLEDPPRDRILISECMKHSIGNAVLRIMRGEDVKGTLLIRGTARNDFGIYEGGTWIKEPKSLEIKEKVEKRATEIERGKRDLEKELKYLALKTVLSKKLKMFDGKDRVI